MSLATQFTWKQVAFSQLTIILFSIVAGLYRDYYIYVIIAYFVALPILISRQARRIGGGRVSSEEVESGRKLWEERDVSELLAKDVDYVREMSEQMKATTYAMISMPAILGYIYLYRKALAEHVRSLTPDPSLAAFLDFFVMFEGSFFISQAFTLYMRKKLVKKMPSMVIAPRRYLVTDRGISAKGFGTTFALKFPLENVAVAFNERRKFVELTIEHPEKSGASTRIRLYSRNPKRLYEIIRRRVSSQAA